MPIISVDGVEFTGKTAVIDALKQEFGAQVFHARSSPMRFDIDTYYGVLDSFQYYVGELRWLAGQLKQAQEKDPKAVLVVDRLFTTQAMHLALAVNKAFGDAPKMALEVRDAMASMPYINVPIFLYVEMDERRRRAEAFMAAHRDAESKPRYWDETLAKGTQKRFKTIARSLRNRGVPVVEVNSNTPLNEVPRVVLEAVRARLAPRISAPRRAAR